MNTKDERHFLSAHPIVWEPKEDSGKPMKAFMKKIQNKYNVKLENFWDIHKWSIENVDKFWSEMWEDSEIIHSKSYEKVVNLSVPMYEFPDWFSGARLNFAENLLRYRDDHIAIIAAGERRTTVKYTYADLYEQVKLFAAALRKHGIKKGDKISCFMPNREEAVFAMIAAVSIGAVWMGALPLMGAQAVLNRFNLVGPKILFTIDHFSHNKEEQDMLPKLKEISENLQSLEKIIIVASAPSSKSKDISNIKNSCFLDDFLESGRNADGSVPEIVFEQVPFTYPVFLDYTSGTTGLPKGLVHDSGILLASYRDFNVQNTCDRNSCWLSNSPVGWATWNYIATQLAFGITLVLFEGIPHFLSPTFLWDMIDEFKVSHMLLTPSILDELEKREYIPLKHHDLSSLTLAMCGGSVLKPQNYYFFYNKVRKEGMFTDVYGLTELCGCGMIANEILPIRIGEIPAPLLGVNVEVMDESGKCVYGEVGELVIASPLPTLPEIWCDDDRSKLKNSYYNNHTGKFSIGDMAMINPITRGISIHGRSDDTLKPRGCRFGSAEIYNIVDTFPEIKDSLCVSHYNKKREERAVLFLKMKPGHAYSEDLVNRIKKAIAKELSVRHVPEVYLETTEIPYNMNGKKLEIIVKKIINKMPYSPATVINPESLKYYKDRPELGDFV